MVYFCADDYGMSEQTCCRIEKCAKNGVLNKISVLPNGIISDFKDRFSDINVTLSLHINLVEGKPLSNPRELDLLVSDNGYFKHSFVGLYLMSISPKRIKLEKQIYNEIRSQLKFWKDSFDEGTPITLDSHHHTHMIPLVFKTLMRAIKDEGLDVAYLRIPAEPITPYLLTPSLYLTYNPKNFIKQLVLKTFAFINKNEIKKSGINSAYYMGILFSGNMDEKRVNKVLVHYLELSEKNNKDIELTFHPGYLESGDEFFDANKKSFHKFYDSPGRRTEFDTLINLQFQTSDMKEGN